MTNTLELTWDVQDGNLVYSLETGEDAVVLDTLEMDHGEIIEAFAEDFQEATEFMDPDRLLEWELLAANFHQIAGTIDTAIEALKAQRDGWRKGLKENGPDWS
jgi:hypothetical protein